MKKLARRKKNPSGGDALLWIGGGALLATAGYFAWNAWKSSQAPAPPPSPTAQALSAAQQQAYRTCIYLQQGGTIPSSYDCRAAALLTPQ